MIHNEDIRFQLDIFSKSKTLKRLNELDGQLLLVSLLRDWFRIRKEIRFMKKNTAKKRITIFFNDYPVGEGVSGGSRRILEIVKNVRYNGMKMLVTFNNGGALQHRLISENLIEVTFPKSYAHRAAEKYFSDRNGMSIDDIVSSIYCAKNNILIKFLDKIFDRVDNVVLEHPYMAKIVEYLKNKKDTINVIYDSHNVESELKKIMSQTYDHTHKAEVEYISKYIENLAVKLSQHINCVTQSDCEKMKRLFELNVLPKLMVNGATVKKIAPKEIDYDVPLKIAFVGSAHGPNVIAIKKYLNEVHLNIDRCELHIVGSVCDYINEFKIDNVFLHGLVKEDEKYRILEDCSIAINPMTIGGGSSLKIGDYLSHGLPVITTKEGSRGFALINNFDAMIVDDFDGFKVSIEILRKNKELYKSMSAHAIDYAKKNLDWNAVASVVSSELV